MDPLDIKKLKRVATKAGMVEGPLGGPRKIQLVTHQCPSSGSSTEAEGVVLPIPSEATPAITLTVHRPTPAPKAGASLSAP